MATRRPSLRRIVRAVREAWRRDSLPTMTFAPPGHFYSPLPDLDDVRRRADVIFADSGRVPGVDLGEERQLRMLEALASYRDELPFTESPTPANRYCYENPYFGHADAIVLYSLLRHFRPRRVIEVGSGWSSAAMLDTCDRFLGGEVEITLVEPYPERLLSLLRDGDEARLRILRCPVQDVDPATFGLLEANDVLFVDSSHVAKAGSDVCHLLFAVLPALAAGVLVHFHDVLWPFEYPREWLMEGRAWNEAYLLRSFLAYNAEFEILLFNSFLGRQHRDAVARCWPQALRNSGGSLWLRRRVPGAGTPPPARSSFA